MVIFEKEYSDIIFGALEHHSHLECLIFNFFNKIKTQFQLILYYFEAYFPKYLTFERMARFSSVLPFWKPQNVSFLPKLLIETFILIFGKNGTMGHLYI